MNVTVVETLADLQRTADALARADRIACDIEADGLFRYKAKVCVLQLSTETDAFVIDTLAAWDATLLQPLLGADGPIKIIHDLSFDARLLREAGIVLGNVEDTSITARFLGEKSLGLGSLLSTRLGVAVDKDRQKHDWSRRPLAQDDIDYLVGDVEHLFALAERLRDDARERGITEEIALEVAYMLARALVEPTTDAIPAWTKVKGAREQAPIVRSVLRELLLVREAEAKRRDVPLFKLVGEDSIVSASLKRPTAIEGLVALGFRGAHARAAGHLWLEAIRRGTQRGDVPPEELHEDRPTPPTRDQRQRWKDREAALKAWRSAAAKARNVEPQVVLPGHCLTDIVQLASDSLATLATVPGLGALRITRDGNAILHALAPVAAPSPVA